MPPPPVPEIVELCIDDVVYPGRGLARHDALVIFVEGVIVGERVRARITRRRKRYAEARLVEVLEPSPHRIAPACPLALRPEAETQPDAGICPGCAYQHVGYEEELRYKVAQLADLVERMGGGPAEGPASPALAAPAPLEYRNKIVLHTAHGPEQTVLGYIGRDHQSVVPVTSCPLACPAINARLSDVLADQQMLCRLKPKTDVTFRSTPSDGVYVWTGTKPRVKKWLTETTALGPLRTPLTGFHQVNPAAADLLLHTVEEQIRAARPRAVIDLYGGVGLFALAAAAAGVPAVLGIESDRAAIQAAEYNARQRDMEHIDFITARVENVLDEALQPVAPEETLLLVDPPRRGLPPGVCDTLAARGPHRILYVSCAPDTLARDLKTLRRGGYLIDTYRVIDMFPRTAHFETCVALRRQD